MKAWQFSQTPPASALDEGQTGMATIWVLVLAAVIAFAGTAAVAIAQVALVRQRVSIAADMSALAGAAQLAQTDEVVACEESGEVARENHAVLVSCQVDFPNVTVLVELPVPELVTRLAQLAHQGVPMIRVRARAGPPVTP